MPLSDLRGVNGMSDYSNDELADELEARGYIVYNDHYHLVGEISDDDLIAEYDGRGLQHFDFKQDAIDYLQSKGYSVYNTNEIEDIWHDIYNHSLTLDHEKFMMWLNEQFIKNIEKWL
jgi:hypothetical protein